MRDAGWSTPHTHSLTVRRGLYNARGLVRDAAEVGRVWGSFRRSTFRREGGVVFRFHTETSTGRPYRRTSTSTRELDLAVSDRRAAVGLRV
jgi:hypothetical protein